MEACVELVISGRVTPLSIVFNGSSTLLLGRATQFMGLFDVTVLSQETRGLVRTPVGDHVAA